MNLADSHFGEFDQRVETMLERLTPACRQALVLRDVEGWKYRAIAEALQLSVPAVRQRVQQGRRELRVLLRQEGE